jgi:hypothetical protein
MCCVCPSSSFSLLPEKGSETEDDRPPQANEPNHNNYLGLKKDPNPTNIGAL